MSIEDVIAQIGFHVAEQLLRMAPGVRFLIPHDPAALGPAFNGEQGRALCRKFGGSRCDIPRDEKFARDLRERRDVAIRWDKRGGMRTDDLLRKYEITSRQLEVAVQMVEG